MKSKDKAKILAKSVYEAVSGKDKKAAEKIVANFLAYLKNHRLINLSPSILYELEGLYFQEQGIVGATIYSKDKLAEKQISEISKLLSDKTKKKIVVSQIVDEDIIGGAIVRYQDKIIDLSIKNQLNKLAKQLSN